MKKYFYSVLLLMASMGFACAQDKTIGPEIITPETKNYTVETVVEGLTIPWGMAFLPEGGILIAEKEGKMILFKDGKKTELEGMPEVTVQGQGGLLDVAVHPDYKKNRWIYFSYASSEGEGSGANTAIARAKLN